MSIYREVHMTQNILKEKLYHNQIETAKPTASQTFVRLL